MRSNITHKHSAFSAPHILSTHHKSYIKTYSYSSYRELLKHINKLFMQLAYIVNHFEFLFHVAILLFGPDCRSVSDGRYLGMTADRSHAAWAIIRSFTYKLNP